MHFHFATWLRLGGEAPLPSASAELDDTHPLHDSLLLQVIREHRALIDEQWAQHMADRIAVARGSFAPRSNRRRLTLV